MSNPKPVSLVTGAATGIGRSAAIALARNGYDVAINYSRSEDAAKFTAEQAQAAGAKTILCRCDQSEDAEARAMLAAIEKEFGRQPKRILNEPRLLDLDLIAFGNETRATDKLILPHPRAHERRFVLQPLSEIAPELRLPRQSRTVAELLESLPADETLRRI